MNHEERVHTNIFDKRFPACLYLHLYILKEQKFLVQIGHFRFLMYLCI